MAAKRDSKKKKQQRNRQRRGIAELAQKLEQNELLQGQPVVLQPSSDIKMSAVMWDFVEPYLPDIQGYEDHQKLFTLAVGAWNIALIPEGEQAKALDTLLGQMMLSPAVLKDLKQILQMMIERKRTHFATNRRFIVEYHLFEDATGLQLAVVSLPAQS